MSTASAEVLIDLDAAERAFELNKSLPTSWYWDSDVFDFELGEIFAHTWHLAGPLCKLENPGDHIVCSAGRIPIVVTRDKAGELHGFVNVCRHRGYAVAREDGNRGTLQCMYHGWTYNLDGTLRAASRCAGDPDFEKEGIALAPVSVDTWAGLVFVNPDPDAKPLREVYPEAEAIAKSLGIDFSSYRFNGPSTYEVDANWKTWLENATECYHCATIHQHSFGETYWDDPDKQVEFGEKILGGNEPYHGRSPLLERYGIEPPSRGQRYIYLWPSFIMGLEDFHAYATTTIPVGPEHTKFVSYGFMNDEFNEGNFQNEWMEMWDQTFREDVDVVTTQQKGLRSGTMDFGQLAPVADRMTRKFHRIVLDGYQDAMASREA